MKTEQTEQSKSIKSKVDYYNYILNHQTMRRQYIKAKEDGNITEKRKLEKELKELRQQDVTF